MEDRHGRAGWAPATYFRPMMQTESGQSSINGDVVGEWLLSVLCAWCTCFESVGHELLHRVYVALFPGSLLKGPRKRAWER